MECDMESQVDQFLQRECRVNRPQLIAIGVSGGVDSLCLMHLLHRLGYSVLVVYFNHQLREEAGSDLLEVTKVANSMGLPVVGGEGDVAAYGREHSLSLEEAARKLRYRFLFAQAHQFQAQAVAVGHTADDQVETVVMHLLRGAGLPGLKGMLPHTTLPDWSPDIPLIRPLLSMWREEISNYCAAHGLKPIVDRSNLDTTFYRNRLRHELIPLLKTYNPRIQEVIWRMARVLSGDRELLQAATDETWRTCVLEETASYLALEKSTFLSLPPAMKRRILRRVIARFRPSLRDINLKVVARAIASIERVSSPRQCDLMGGLRIFFDDNRLWVAAEEGDLPTHGMPQLADEKSRWVKLQGELALPEGWRLKMTLIPDPKGVPKLALRNTDPFQTWVDADALEFPLEVRSRRSGERFQLLGMEGHSIRLSDLMINLKLPRRARDKWPLIYSRGEVVWLPGYRLGHPFRLKEDTKRVVKLRLFEDDGDE